MEEGSRTVDLNLMRTKTLTKTRQIQVDRRTAITHRTYPSVILAWKQPFKSSIVLFCAHCLSCFEVQAGQRISGTLEGLQEPKPQQGGTALPGVEQRHRKQAGPTSLSSSLSPGEKQTLRG